MIPSLPFVFACCCAGAVIKKRKEKKRRKPQLGPLVATDAGGELAADLPDSTQVNRPKRRSRFSYRRN